MFNYRIGSSAVVYALGDNSIKTALDDSGFERRVQDGKIAARDLIAKLRNGQILLYQDSKIDIVAHSMGYAFALGMIEELQSSHFNIGWFYAIAPENPGAGFVPNNIDGIWQYGSQETDPFNKQDGIAPQKPISGLSPARRVPIDPSAPQDFFNSHSIANYHWILKKSSNVNGYVKSRKK